MDLVKSSFVLVGLLQASAWAVECPPKDFYPKKVLPEIRSVDFELKKVASAKDYGVETLSDGRVRYRIEHEILKGVTPEMLVWWFSNIDGTMIYNEKEVPRYHIWHPEDHVCIDVLDRSPEGEVVPGVSRFHIIEALGRRRDYLVDTYSVIERLDEGGFRHGPRDIFGKRLAVFDYSFEAIYSEDDPSQILGTRYVNSATIGVDFLPRSVSKMLNGLVAPMFFDEEKGMTWIKHNIEEVGTFEFFLPDLYEEAFREKP